MTELGIKELKKIMLSLMFPFIFIILILLITMSAFSATTADEVSSVRGILATEEGQRMYEEVWKQPIMDVYELTNVNLPLAWFIIPSCMIDDPFSIEYERAKMIVMLAVDENNGTYKQTTVEKYAERIVKESEFEDIESQRIVDIIEENLDVGNITTIGNVPKDLKEYRKLNLSLPVKTWSQIGEIGMYNPFGEWRMHYGMDIACPTGTPLYAAADARVEQVSYSDSGGNGLILRNGTLVMVYYHMRELSFKKPGDIVYAGELVGFSGSTGRVTGPHLHFETWSTDASTIGAAYAIKKQIYFNPRIVWDFD